MSKKIIPIVALSIIAVLVIATIIMACVPKSYEPINCEPNRIVIIQDNEKPYFKDSSIISKENANTFNKLYENYKSSFQESSINALFRGRLGYKANVQYREDLNKKPASVGTKSIVLYFNKELSVKVEGTEYKYDRAVISLTSSNIMESIKVYLYNETTYNDGTDFYLETIGNLQKLVDYVNSL